MQSRIVRQIKEVDFTIYRVPMIVIYEHPGDYPSQYVARVFDIDGPKHIIMLKDTLMEIQKEIQENTNMIFTGRNKEDDPCIVGVWI